MPTSHVKTDSRGRISLAKIPGIKKDQYYRVELGAHGRIVLEPVTFVTEAELPAARARVEFADHAGHVPKSRLDWWHHYNKGGNE